MFNFMHGGFPGLTSVWILLYWNLLFYKETNNPVSKNIRYLVYVLVFVLSLFVFDRALFYLIRLEENAFYKKKDFASLFTRKRNFNRNVLKLPKGTYNTLIMGSSRTHRGIHPYYIHKRLGQNAFKIARGKTKPRFNYLFYNEYKKLAGTPKVVIYGLDYFIFKKESDPLFMQYIARDEERKPAAGVSLLISNKNRIDGLLTNILETYALNREKEVHPGLDRRKNIPVIDPFIGYGKSKQEPINPRKPSRFKTFEYVPYPGEEGTWFIELLRELEKDRVTVALVILPEYIGTYESNFQREAFLKDIRELIEPFPNATLFDYNRPDKFRLSNTAYFLDGGYGKTNSHLSLKGARVFNRMLAKDLKKCYNR